MSEAIPPIGDQPPRHQIDPRLERLKLIGNQVTERLVWLQDAADVVGGPGAQIEAVFDVAPAVRNEAPMPNWTAEQAEQVRAIAARFGYGARETASANLPGSYRMLEGGKAWKIDAEEIAADEEGTTGGVLFSGSPRRKLGEDELSYVYEKYGVELPGDTTEYDYARFKATLKVVGDTKQTVLPFGYAVAEGNPFTDQPTGQLIELGKDEAGQPVQLLRVDREDYINEADEPKYRYQPDTARLMGFVAEVLDAQSSDSAVVQVTSSTYASRYAGAVQAGLRHDRIFGVTLYGRNTLIGLQQYGANVPNEMPLNHIPGDLRSMYDKLTALRQTLKTAIAEQELNAPDEV